MKFIYSFSDIHSVIIFSVIHTGYRPLYLFWELQNIKTVFLLLEIFKTSQNVTKGAFSHFKFSNKIILIGKK